MIIYHGNDYIFIPGDANYAAISPTLKMTENGAGVLTFSLLPAHPMYYDLDKLSYIIRVVDDNETIFKGRILSTEIGIDNIMSVTVEGKLATLNDTPIRPYEHNGTPAELFSYIIDNHNLQVSESQQLIVGNVTVTDPNDYINRSWTGTLTSWECLKTRLLDTLGGYVQIRYTSNGDYIDYLQDFDVISTQGVTYGDNIIDLSMLLDGANTYTAIIPYGAEIETPEYVQASSSAEWEENKYYEFADGEYYLITTQSDFNRLMADGLVFYISSMQKTGERVTIASVNSGRDYLIDDTMSARYGVIYAPTSETTWDDVTIPSNLLTKAQLWLADNVGFKQSTDITFADLYRIGIDTGKIKQYIRVEVFSDPHNISADYLVTDITYNLAAPETSTIKVGATVKTLTDRAADRQQETSDLAQQIIEVSGDQISQNDIINISADVTNKLITQTLQAAGYIQSSVLDERLTSLNDELRTQIQNEISSSITQTAQSWEAVFTALERKVDANGQYINEQKTYITQDINGITISADGTAVKAVFGIDSLKFMYGTLTLAEFSSEELIVDSLKAKKQISFNGEWAWRKGAYISGVGNNLNLYFLGG